MRVTFILHVPGQKNLFKLTKRPLYTIASNSDEYNQVLLYEVKQTVNPFHVDFKNCKKKSIYIEI